MAIGCWREDRVGGLFLQRNRNLSPAGADEVPAWFVSSSGCRREEGRADSPDSRLGRERQSFTLFFFFFFCSNSLEAPLSAHKTPMYPVKILHLLPPSHLPSPTLMSFVCLPGHNNTAVTSGCRRERSMPSVRGCCW